MISRTQHRRAALAVPVLAASFFISACGAGDGDAASLPTVTLNANETAYQTLPPETTTTTIAGDVVEVGAESTYTVQSGDYGLKVANQFGVSLEDLSAINGWADIGKEFPFPGTEIKIPAGGTVAQPSVAGATPAGTDTAATGTAGEAAGATIPEVGSSCEAGRHIVKDGDIPLKLVDLYDVTLEALNAANADNPAYTRFIPGETIIIPAKPDC